MGETIIRQWLVLTMLPKPPRRIDTGALVARLRERGVEVHKRTVQRDLLELAEVFPIVVDDRAKPYGWRWADGADALDVPFAQGGTTPRIEVKLRVRRDGMPSVLERLRFGPRRVLDDGKDSDVATVIRSVEDSRCFRRRLFGIVAEVEVVGPATLRAELVAHCRRVLKLHDP
jgi:hypothetical protein